MLVSLTSDANWREALIRERERGAELICLPQLSFLPYIAASRDRSGLERAERPPSATLREARSLIGECWLAASTYESEGEGVFFVTSHLIGPGPGAHVSYRQRSAEAAPGRFEQMFWSPGYERQDAVATPLGAATTLVGGDVGDPDSWRRAASTGARVVLGGSSEPAERWQRTQRVIAGLAATHGMTALVCNRREPGTEFAGGAAAYGPDGAELEPDSQGLYEVMADG